MDIAIAIIILSYGKIGPNFIHHKNKIINSTIKNCIT